MERMKQEIHDYQDEINVLKMQLEASNKVQDAQLTADSLEDVSVLKNELYLE